MVKMSTRGLTINSQIALRLKCSIGSSAQLYAWSSIKTPSSFCIVHLPFVVFRCHVCCRSPELEIKKSQFISFKNGVWVIPHLYNTKHAPAAIPATKYLYRHVPRITACYWHTSQVAPALHLSDHWYHPTDIRISSIPSVTLQSTWLKTKTEAEEVYGLGVVRRRQLR
jgi:hypothetical protein